MADKHIKPKYGNTYVRCSPIGAIFGIEPCNFPFYQVARFAAPNIMVENTVLVKHVSMVPQCGIAIEDLFNEANAPNGL